MADRIEPDVREKFLVTAERLFREIGHQKTTVADIAKVLQMSPANVYRSFDLKKSINTGVAWRLMSEVEQAAQAIAANKGSAAARLRKLLTTVHQMTSARYVADSKMHDMVACAMEENWDVCKAHIEFITGTIASVIASGVASGEFHMRDVGIAALHLCSDDPLFRSPVHRGIRQQARFHARPDDRFRRRGVARARLSEHST